MFRVFAKPMLYGTQIVLNITIGYLFFRMLASLQGVSEQKAAFDIAYSVPYILLSLCGFVFLHSSLVSHFNSVAKNKTRELCNDFSVICSWLIVVSILGSLLCFALIKPLSLILAPGFSAQSQHYLIRYTLLFIPLILSSSLFAVVSAALISQKVAITAEVNTLVSRIGVVAFFWLSSSRISLDAIAISLSFSSYIALLIALSLLYKKTNIRFCFQLNAGNSRLWAYLKQSLYFILVAILAQCSFSAMRALASLESEEVVAAFGYAMSVLGPLSILIGKPIALAFGADFSTGDISFGAVKKYFISCLLISIVATACIYSFSLELTSLLFGVGSFGQSAASLTAGLLSTTSLALPALVAMWLLLFPLLSLNNQHLAPRVYLIGYLAHLIFSFVGYYLGGSQGLCWAYVFMNYLQLGVAWKYLMLEPEERSQPINENSNKRLNRAVSNA